MATPGGERVALSGDMPGRPCNAQTTAAATSTTRPEPC
eukprot:CAMPEP_0115567158 /NCGR_PEP_ID=MMETSP0271-20121206/103962_1 /TAXON_ID=71861 /ORGANISM="Scrippsiella trochoidea, Strain CCMP3099" /LENGTH=37 /DNA_ID= /DNA_START= /DNA_END= /DNA_ORIENTATION=